MDSWGMGFGFILWPVILAVIIAGVVSIVRSQPVRGGHRRSTGLDCLKSVTHAEKLPAKSISKRSATLLSELTNLA